MSDKLMPPSHSFIFVVVAAIILVSIASPAPTCNAKNIEEGGSPPQESKQVSKSSAGGLARLYPGDEGIERDPRVLFVEDFETGAPDDIGARWGQIYRGDPALREPKENVTLSDDIHSQSPGYKSIHFKNNAHLYTHTKGVDTMYVRFYVKFHEKTGYIHHFVHLVADRTPTPWPKGGAGETPTGDAKFSTGIEPTGRWGKFPPPGVWNFYTYWHEMKTKWGSVFNGKQEPIVPGRWYCVEAMLKANSSPEKADGEQAFWIDGELYGRFTGFRWRTTDKLKINSFWLLYYNTDQPAQHNKDPHPESRVMEVWFDPCLRRGKLVPARAGIVIATDYIGPIHGKPKDGKTIECRVCRFSAYQSFRRTPDLIGGGMHSIPYLLIAEPGDVAYSQNFEDGPDGSQRVAQKRHRQVYNSLFLDWQVEYVNIDKQDARQTRRFQLRRWKWFYEGK